jgi:methionine sulfoxide reductase heme-binding subunit
VVNVLSAMGTQVLWYVSRGTGLVLLVLLTAVVVLGVAVRASWGGERVRRFVVEGVHRNLALLSVVLLVVHVVTAIADPFVHIGWLATIVPFTSAYRSLWIGLGTVSVDVLLLVIVTSLFRRHMHQRGWRVVHWLAYLAWPLAFVHSLYAGDDTRLDAVAALDWCCLATVLAVLAARLVAGTRGRNLAAPASTGPLRYETGTAG